MHREIQTAELSVVNEHNFVTTLTEFPYWLQHRDFFRTPTRITNLVKDICSQNFSADLQEFIVLNGFHLLLSESGIYSKQHISLQNQFLDRSELSRDVYEKRF